MELSQKKLSAAVVFMMMLVMAAEMGQVKARECITKSGSFHGFCFRSSQCAAVCRQESPSYNGGRCGGLRLNCFCTTPCTASPAPAA
ncbi:hypothetical protein ACP70R_019574 [Stipagrostis hirtigluma subsp. patula]